MSKWDEFESPRERREAYPTMRAYGDSRTIDQLAILMCVDTYQRNVFGTYPGTVGNHSREILLSVRERGRREGMEEAAKVADNYDVSVHMTTVAPRSAANNIAAAIRAKASEVQK